MALVPEKKSGVGATLERTLEKLLKIEALKEWEVYFIVTLGKAKYLKAYQSNNVKIKTIYLPARMLEIFARTRLLLPIDWFLGVGLYVFPNYRNWPLWRSRSITYVYDVGYSKYPETVQVKNQKYLHRFMPGWMRRTDRVITISNQVKYEIEKYLGLNESQIDIVPCGVDRSIFYKRSNKEIKSVKERYDISYDKYFLFVGNIEPRKNLEKLLQAYEKLPVAIQNEYALILVGGDGWQNDLLYEKISKMQSEKKSVFKVLKYVVDSDLPALYSGATLLIHPAIYEGFGITPLEAMACGVPVVVSDTPAIREVVQDAGLYFDPNSAKEIASAIQTTLEDTALVDKNIVRGLAIAQEFSWENSAKQLFKILENEQKTKNTHRHPILARLKRLYQVTNRRLLYFFGEREYEVYAPPHSETVAQLRQNILNDFIREQPSRTQLLLKRIYLSTKSAAATVVKSVYHHLSSRREDQGAA